MKLTQELKNKIDEYFDNVSAEDLYELAIGKYNFSEITLELENERFETINEPFYSNFEMPENNMFQVIDFCELACAS